MRHSVLPILTALVCIAGIAAAQEESPTALEAPADDARAVQLDLAGVTVTPHVRAHALQFSDPAVKEGPLGARLQFFVQNTAADRGAVVTLNDVSFDRSYPLLQMLDGNWSWADTPNEWPGHQRVLPAGALMVWTINAVHPTWTNNEMRLTAVDWSSGGASMRAPIEEPQQWIAAVTFLGDTVNPDRLVVHVTNAGDEAISLNSVRLWLPQDRRKFRVLFPQEPLSDMTYYPADGVVPPGEKGIITASTDPLPLTYAAVEVNYESADGNVQTLWGHVRVKREIFDIAGGWIGGAAADGKNLLQHEAFLKMMKRLYVNAGHIGEVPGYNDAIGQGGLYDQYSIKKFYDIPVAKYDSPEMIEHVHGAEILGEPQLPFGGKLPQLCYEEFGRYRDTRIPTTVTLSDERTFRHYAGLSDYPPYDAYRVIAPSADSWRRYDRWNGQRIGWGAPLETIGDLCRVLREMSRPMPTAVWSQGPHEGWYTIDGRDRLSPTPDELRSQAYHALSSRITSLYWFNLSLRSLLQFPDTWPAITEIGREIRMLENFYLAGDAYEYKRTLKPDGGLDWDLATIAAPHGALLFALDLDYTPDPDEKVFTFAPPRDTAFTFKLPPWLHQPADVFRVDAHGVYDAQHQVTGNTVTIHDTQALAAIYVVASDETLRNQIESRRTELIAQEKALNFNPTQNPNDMTALKALRP